MTQGYHDLHKLKRPSARAATAGLLEGAADVTDSESAVARRRRTTGDADKSGRRVSARANESSPSEVAKGSRPARARATETARADDVAVSVRGQAVRDAEHELERDVQGLLGDLGSVDKDTDGRQRVTAESDGARMRAVEPASSFSLAVGLLAFTMFVIVTTEFVLEGLHLHQRLNKEAEGARYTYRA